MNWNASFQTPDHVRQEWASQHGLPVFASEVYLDALETVCKRLGVKPGDALSFLRGGMGVGRGAVLS